MRCGRSGQAGDLKASNITLPLEWTTMSSRLTLPYAMHGLGLTWYIFECLDLFSSMCKHKVRLTGSVSILDGIEFDLKVLKPDGKVSIFVIKVTIAIDLVGEAQIVMFKECAM